MSRAGIVRLKGGRGNQAVPAPYSTNAHLRSSLLSPSLSSPDHQSLRLALLSLFLSFRDVEEMLAMRGVSLSYETVREWCLKFGQVYANRLRHKSPRPGDRWHLVEVPFSGRRPRCIFGYGAVFYGFMVGYRVMNKEGLIEKAKAYQAELRDLGEQLTKLDAMENVLRQDTLDCEKLVTGEHKTDSGCRSFIRSIFALIEGSVFNLKQTSLTLSRHGRGEFSQAELAMLEDVSYELGDKGEAKEQVKFIPLTKNIRFAFSTTARAFQVDYVLVVDDVGWSTFKDALLIRNRITHPKSIDDLSLSDQEIQIVADAGTWFLRNKHALLQKLIDRMQVLKDILDKTPAPPA